MERAREKRTRLRQGFESALGGGSPPVVAVGAHDAMTAQLIETHGFDAVWVSGFGVSTMTYALPDMNLVTMAETLEASTRIDAATSLPVIVDCDNGYGGLSNVVRTVRDFERAGIAAICVEDNTFPKRNSLFQGESKRELIPAEEQARRIREGKRAQETEEFLFIARVEALIAGHGVADACERADAYVDAGADAILIHSRDKTLGEIEGFLDEWQGTGSIPLVAVPTLFPTFTAEQLGEKGFQLVIFANQTMRAAVDATERTLATMARERNAASVDPDIASVNHIFELVKTQEAIELEEVAS
jgi:phosphoenolpyruvate phosphomutase